MTEEIQGQISLLVSEMQALRAQFDQLGEEIKQKTNDRAIIASEIVGRQKAVECLERLNREGQKTEAMIPKAALVKGG